MSIKELIEALQDIARLYGDHIPVVTPNGREITDIQRGQVDHSANAAVLKTGGYR